MLRSFHFFECGTFPMAVLGKRGMDARRMVLQSLIFEKNEKGAVIVQF